MRHLPRTISSEIPIDQAPADEEHGRRAPQLRGIASDTGATDGTVMVGR